MDPLYDTELAKKQLDVATDTFRKQDSDEKVMDNVETANLEVVYVEAPRSWRIVKRKEYGSIEVQNDGFEEEMFNMHGVLCSHDLPPIETRDVHYLKKKAKFIRQAVRLTGFDTPVFRETVTKMREINELFRDSIHPIEMAVWQPSTYEGEPALELNARYFTARRNSPHERGQAFAAGVDPFGVLAEIRGQDLIHGNDNKVDYLKEYKDSIGETRRKTIEPAIFNIGDIVRATVSVVAFPTREGKAQMSTILRALTLIESFKSAPTEKMLMNTLLKATTIKRKIIFDEEKDARDSFDRMKIDDNTVEEGKRRKCT